MKLLKVRSNGLISKTRVRKWKLEEYDSDNNVIILSRILPDVGAGVEQGGLALEEATEDVEEEGWGFEDLEGILVSVQNSGGEEEEAFEETVEDIVEEQKRGERVSD